MTATALPRRPAIAVPAMPDSRSLGAGFELARFLGGTLLVVGAITTSVATGTAFAVLFATTGDLAWRIIQVLYDDGEPSPAAP